MNIKNISSQNKKKGGLKQRKSFKYFEHSTQFVNWINRFNFEKTVLGQLFVLFEEKFQIRKLAILFLFSLSLSAILFFDFDFNYHLRVGEIAPVDVKSPLSFEIVDDVATEEKRYEAELSVPTVFDYDREVYENVLSGVFKAFRSMRILFRKESWPKNEFKLEEKVKDFFVHKKEFQALLGVQIPDRIFEWLVQNQFNARIENILVRTLENWSYLRIADAPNGLINKDHQKIIIRSIFSERVGEEFTLKRDQLIDIAQISNFVLEGVVGWDKLSPADQKKMTKFARLLIKPNVIPNIKETSARRQKAKQEVLPIVLSVKKGQSIIREGTVVRPIHLSLLRQIRSAKENRNASLSALVTAFLFVTLILVFFSYLRRFSLNRVQVDSKDIGVMGLVTFLVILLTKLFLFMTDAAFMARFGHVLTPQFFLFLAPVAAGPMLVGLLIAYGEVVWLFTAFMSIALGLMAENNYSFMIVSLVGGIAAARGVYSCKKRNDIYRAGLRTGLVNALMIAIVISAQVNSEGDFLPYLLQCVLAGFLGGIFSSMIAMTVIPVLETLFNYTTDVRLLELSNLNQSLLKQMLVKAPGTYHHSMIVGSMVDAAAEEIGANSLLAKVMAYYHDIGKMNHSGYFIENQRRGHNPHDQISPYMSKTILIAHVKDGAELAMKHNLGKPIIDGITQHHGTTVMGFFYNKAKEGGKVVEPVSEDDFCYPGPKPQFRESGLLMLADSIEAAARCLEEPTPMRIQNIVKNIIQRKFLEGQLDHCNLTLKDLNIIDNSFVKTLLSIYHQRIDYPKNSGGGASEKPIQPISLLIDKRIRPNSA